MVKQDIVVAEESSRPYIDHNNYQQNYYNSFLVQSFFAHNQQMTNNMMAPSLPPPQSFQLQFQHPFDYSDQQRGLSAFKQVYESSNGLKQVNESVNETTISSDEGDCDEEEEEGHVNYHGSKRVAEACDDQEVKRQRIFTRNQGIY